MQLRRVVRGAAFVALAAIVLTYALPALAQAAGADQPANRLDEIVRRFRDMAATWEGPLRSIAMRLFGLLVSIEVIWTFITLALKSADFSEWVAELVNRIMYVGFFSALILNSAKWSTAIVQSFREAGAAAYGAGGDFLLRPSAIFASGVELASRIWEGLSVKHPGTSLGLAMAGLIILVIFAWMSALVILALVESYIVISAGVLLMGFGGSRWTKEYAVKSVTYAMSVGAKLFVLELILGLGAQMIREWTAAYPTAGEQTDVFIMVGVAIVLLALAKQIPETVQAIINGTHVGSGSAIVGAAAAVAGGAAAVAGAVTGTGSSVGAAFKLAREQVAGGEGGSMVGHAARNLGQAAKEDIGARLSGRTHHGHMPWRMSSAMGDQAEKMKEARVAAQAKQDAPAPVSGEAPRNVVRPAAQGREGAAEEKRGGKSKNGELKPKGPKV